ncbi:lipoprotein insertase outer membrane protein LolB [Nissabacter sp. SGAir0207]|uniref:lipoprotein insertase outer membrane protein LolB n=1 Tax=Nissabacter sp. SGAir0207 TaxID=2126321 RepID=UPI0010CCE926|nr:lipoprotein insertase outer membrane protein LolB [Nissabacter sp. SGAir0207]QCR35927.1 lipoprotein localization factor LolB [Nissabacter sp. SGAir0207]
MPMQPRTRLPALLRLLPLASVLLAACSTTPRGPATSPDSPQWQQHQQQVQHLSAYQTRGAFAYLSDRQKVYANFFWQQFSPTSYRLLLTNPLGSTEMELKVQNGVAQLTNSEGKQYVSDNPEEMLQKLTGMAIPLNSLRQWMLGLPGDASDFTLDDRYRLSALTYQQNGLTWKVTYADYNDEVQPSLPSNLTLTQGEQRIKLKMNRWVVSQ